MVADYQNIRVEVSDGVATLMVDRQEVLNALDVRTTEEIAAAAITLDADPDVRAVIVTGAGDKAFVAGADISVLVKYGPEEGRRASAAGQRAFDLLERMGKPVIAALNGYALGAGCELALACHIRIASDRAKIGLPEINLSIIPGHGGTQRLPRLIGKGRALELICRGEPVDAATAERIGLVNQVVSHEELWATVQALAAEFASKAPMAMRYCIQAVNEGLETSLAEGQVIESTYFSLCCATDDKKEGMTAFLEKRQAEWTGS
jgi:enoyl-CoA hydratase